MSQNEIYASLADGWHIGTIELATIDITSDRDGIQARLAALTRT